MPDALPALNRLRQLGWPVIVVTNQSAVGRGLVASRTIDEIHRRMVAEITATGGRIDAVFVCPHHPDSGCTCRKPRPGLLLQAAEAFRLTLRDCYVIGDSIIDMAAATAVGSRPILVQTGLQGPALPELLRATPDVPLVAHLGEAVDCILSRALRAKRPL